jgi:hypothetical protein
MTRSSRGFSLLEVLVAGVIGVIGLFGSLTLSVMALKGNSDRRDGQMAMQLAEHMLATIQSEATMWTGDEMPSPVLPWLNKLPAPPSPGQTSGWLSGPSVPFSQDKRVGPLGADSRYDQGALLEMPSDVGTRYCVHYRLTWVTDQVVRAEVRVAWARPHVPADKYKACPVDMLFNVGEVGSVSMPALLSRNTNVQ